MKYEYKTLEVDTYIDSLYEDGLQKSSTLTHDEIKNIVLDIGIFKLKGYAKAFREGLSKYTIDDLFDLYNTDRQIALNMISHTSKIEIKLKSLLIETVYSITDNPFAYLVKENYKDNFTLSNDSLHDWEVRVPNKRLKKEVYPHYRDYYIDRYDFKSNKEEYLGSKTLIELNERKDINYPPFHYFVESATLGTLINLISRFKIDDNDILKLLAKKFNLLSHKLFLNYLLRLKELRNRCAHNGRIFNRNYRGLTAFELHKEFRKTIYEHKLIDVYYSLHFLLNDIENFKNVENLVDSFISDNLSECNENTRDFMIRIMKTR